MQPKASDYYSYLLRVWKSSDSDPSTWRISLEDTRGGGLLYFISLETLMDYLNHLVSSDLVPEEPAMEE